MTHYDLRLRELHERTARYRHLRAIVPELQSQREYLEAEVYELQNIMFKEQADVDRLEGRSLAAYFYNVVGKLDQQLDKERREAYAARVKYDTSARELDSVLGELARFEAELDGLEGCEAEFQALLREKSEALKAAGGSKAEAILELETRLGALSSRAKELREAISAGNAAYGTATEVLRSLDSAEGWGTFDLLGGGLISDIAKHSHLDKAQYAVNMLQSDLRRFKTELSDVTINADIQVSIDGFLGFADFFFDGLFADWAVMDRISQSKYRVTDTLNQIENLLRRLNRLSAENEARIADTRARLDELVLGS